MAKQWIDPRYAWLVGQWREARMADARTPQSPPTRAFIVPAPKA